MSRVLSFLILPLFLLGAQGVAAQTDPAVEPVWVLLRDRGPEVETDRGAALVAAAEALPVRTQERRRLRSSLATAGEWDLPPSPNYRQQVLATGASLRHESRWLNAFSVMATPDQQRQLAGLPFVLEVRPVARGTRAPLPRAEALPPSGPAGRLLDYGASFAQLDEIDVPRVHEAGLNGAGVVVLMLDTGYYTDHEALPEAQVLAEWDFINNDNETQNQPGDAPDQHNHGTLTLSALGGSFPGQIYGPAWGASFLLAKTEDVTSETPVEEDHYIAALEWGELLGADVASGSLGYIDWYTIGDLDGQTAPTCAAVNQAVALGMVVCVSAGNERNSDWGHIVTPADATGAIAVGAVNSANVIASFSSPGPTADGRIKPEVCARGVSTVCAGIDAPDHYRTASGTSLSCPLVGGSVALVIQAHPDWTPGQVREALLNTADRAATPDNDFGWGRIRTGQAIEYTRAPLELGITLEGSAIRLVWQAGVGSGYRVFGAPEPGGPWNLLAETQATTWLHADALSNSRLCYRVTSAGTVLP